MRLFARLLQKPRDQLEMHDKCLADFLSNVYFDAAIEAVEDMRDLHSGKYGQRTFGKPSIALAVGNILPKCCQIKKGCAVRNGDDVTVKEVERSMDLFKTNYSNTISCPALSTLKTKSYQKLDELPFTENLMKLKTYTDQQLKILMEQLNSQPTYRSWRKLSEIVLTKLLVFNKRRASEPGKLELTQYVPRPRTSNKEVVADWQPLEKKLM
jgi:hypothetical protein